MKNIVESIIYQKEKSEQNIMLKEENKESLELRFKNFQKRPSQYFVTQNFSDFGKQGGIEDEK